MCAPSVTPADKGDCDECERQPIASRLSSESSALPWDHSWDQTHRFAPTCSGSQANAVQLESRLYSGQMGDPRLGGPPLHTREVAGLDPSRAHHASQPLTRSRTGRGPTATGRAP